MAISSLSGPLVVYGVPAVPVGETNESLGTSLCWGGAGMLDPRVGYNPGQNVTTNAVGWNDTSSMIVVAQAPSALATNNIAAAQAGAVGAMTLVSTSGAGITVGASVTNLTTGQTVGNLLAIDGVPTPVQYGSVGGVAMYDPTKSIARTIRITSAGNDSAATAVIRGYDLYGQPMSEQQTLSNASVTAGKKAFKYVASVTLAGTLSGSNVSVGTGDIYGFPLYVSDFPLVDIYWNSALITATTGFLAGVTTNPATATTGDVRGTYATQSASDGTKVLYMYVTVLPGNLGPAAGPTGGTYAGLFGLPNFTN